MKLKIYNQTNSKMVVAGRSTLRIHKRGGLLTFSKAAAQLMEVTAGDKIEIVQDEESPDNFYVHKTTSPDGFTLRGKEGPNKIITEQVAFNSTKIAQLLAPKFIGVSFPIGNPIKIEGRIYHLIVTSKPINEKIDPLAKK